MQDEKPRVLIVDDSRGDIRIVNENLKDHYTVLAATSGQTALDVAAKDPKPDVILMDVEMPEMNGYETCKKLKSNPSTSDIDVIFVSAHDTVDEILAGYESGGTDYLTKPIEPSQLKTKIKIAVDNRKKRHDISSEKLNIEKIAQTAMDSAGEQGVVLDFFRNSFLIKTPEELAVLIVTAIDQYQLNNTVQLRYESTVIDRATNKCIVPLEKELLTRLKDHNKLIEKGQRAVFNFGDISLLIKTVCTDVEKWGRIRDYISILLDGANAKLESLVVSQQVSSLVLTSNYALEQIAETQREHKKETQNIADRLLERLENNFHSLGLLHDQEEMLFKLVQDGVNETLTHVEKGAELDNSIKEIIKKLQTI
jgi:CheY-like chemotaxis protein